MAVRIRLTRVGATKRPSYRVVAIDRRRPRDGRALEILGFYDPLTEPATVRLETEKIKAWIGKGAQPSEMVSRLLRQAESAATAPAATPKKPASKGRGATRKAKASTAPARAQAAAAADTEAPAAAADAPAEPAQTEATEATAPDAPAEPAQTEATEATAPDAPETTSRDDA